MKFTYLNLFILFAAAAVESSAQQVWNADSCMAYAVSHNRTVKQRSLEADNYRMDRIRAVGNFLPGISGSVGAQYNYGRSVDPETNTYNNISTFNNGYALEASVSLFRGGGLVNELRRSNAAVLLGKAALQEARDNTALETYQAYIDALYYYGTIRLARQKYTDSDSLLYKTRRMEELGLKGRADVAQMEAQLASDAYNLTRQENLYATAMLTLKQQMNYPVADTLVLDTACLVAPMVDHIEPDQPLADDVYRLALAFNPTLRQAELNRKIAKIAKQAAWANVLPSISFYGGLSTSYYKQLHVQDYASFGDQFRNNYGRYFGFSMSIPIFNRLSGAVGIRKERNDYRIASEQYEAQKESLQKLVQQAVQDRQGYLKEAFQMEKKTMSDSIAYTVTRRKYEEGLMTSLDVQNSAATLLESRTSLLRSRLTYLMKCRLVDYYQGKELIRTSGQKTNR